MKREREKRKRNKKKRLGRGKKAISGREVKREE